MQTIRQLICLVALLSAVQQIPAPATAFGRLHPTRTTSPGGAGDDEGTNGERRSRRQRRRGRRILNADPADLEYPWNLFASPAGRRQLLNSWNEPPAGLDHHHWSPPQEINTDSGPMAALSKPSSTPYPSVVQEAAEQQDINDYDPDIVLDLVPATPSDSEGGTGPATPADSEGGKVPPVTPAGAGGGGTNGDNNDVTAQGGGSIGGDGGAGTGSSNSDNSSVIGVGPAVAAAIAGAIIVASAVFLGRRRMKQNRENSEASQQGDGETAPAAEHPQDEDQV